jgi:hypothetical protein
MKNRVLLSCIVASIVAFCPFQSDASSSSSNMGEVRRTFHGLSTIHGLGGFVYLITKDQDFRSLCAISPVNLSDIVRKIENCKPRVHGWTHGIDGYLLECLQEIRLLDGRLTRINLYHTVDVEGGEKQLVYIIAHKELVSLPELGTMIGSIGGATYRLEDVKELESSHEFLLITLSMVS